MQFLTFTGNITNNSHLEESPELTNTEIKTLVIHKNIALSLIILPKIYYDYLKTKQKAKTS